MTDLEFMAEKRLRTPKEVAEMLAMSEKTVWKMCREGLIPHHRIGRQYRLTEGDIEQLLQETRFEPVAGGPVPVGRMR